MRPVQSLRRGLQPVRTSIGSLLSGISVESAPCNRRRFGGGPQRKSDFGGYFWFFTLVVLLV